MLVIIRFPSGIYKKASKD